MSNVALNYIQTIATISREKLVLWAIANRAGKDGRCWPSLKKLAADTGLSLATVKRALSGLEEKGIIRRIPQHADGGRQTVSIIEICGLHKTSSRLQGRGSSCTPGGAQPAPGEGLTVSPPRGSARAPLNKEEPKYEPSSEPLAQQTEKPTNVSGKEFWAKAVAPPTKPGHETVTFENGKLTLHNSTRAAWLDCFGGDERRLELALTTAANYVRPYGLKSLEVQVNAQLARHVADKDDRDARYAAASKVKQGPPKPRPLSRFGVSP